MSSGIDRYLEVLSRKLWATPGARQEILAEIRGHLERALGDGASLEDAERLLGAPVTLAGQINRSLSLDKTRVPSSIHFAVVGGFAFLNVVLWFLIQRTSGWIHGLSAPAGSLLFVAAYAAGTLICVAAGCALAARAQCPRLLIYLIAACPAAYHLIFGLVAVLPALATGTASLGTGAMELVHRLPQALILIALGAATAFATIRLSRYPAEPWHLQGT